MDTVARNRLLCCLYTDKDGVLLLPGVRVPHPDCAALNRLTPEHGCDMIFKKRDGDCHGLGWTPNEDAWVWLDTFFALDGRIKVAILRLLADEWKLRFKEAFYAALESALRPLAVNVAEAQKQAEVKHD